MMLEVLIVNLSLKLFKQLGCQNIVEIVNSWGNERGKNLTSLSSHVIILFFFSLIVSDGGKVLCHFS